MEKLIQELLKKLKIEAILVLFLVCLTIVLGETNIIPNCVVEPNTQTEFTLSSVCILITIILAPGTLRFFQLNTTRGLRRMNNDEALSYYHHWSLVKLGVMALCMLMDTITYYLTMTTTGILCLAVTAMITIYQWPSRQKLEEYLTVVNQEQQV